MKKFEVDFEASAPIWDGVVVEATDKNEAEELAHPQIEQAFPEASDITIVDIKEIE